MGSGWGRGGADGPVPSAVPVTSAARPSRLEFLGCCESLSFFKKGAKRAASGRPVVGVLGLRWLTHGQGSSGTEPTARPLLPEPLVGVLHHRAPGVWEGSECRGFSRGPILRSDGLHPRRSRSWGHSQRRRGSRSLGGKSRCCWLGSGRRLFQPVFPEGEPPPLPAPRGKVRPRGPHGRVRESGAPFFVTKRGLLWTPVPGPLALKDQGGRGKGFLNQLLSALHTKKPPV